MILRINFSNNESIYSIDDTNFTMIVDNFKIDGNKIAITLKGDEDLVATYYIDTYEELIYLKDNIKYGVTLKIKGKLNEGTNNTIPNTFNYKKYLRNKNIYYNLNIEELEILDNEMGIIYKIKNLINERITKIDDTGYMKAFILGDKSGIDSNTYNNYQKIGITHLFALSGMHVGLLSGIILKLLNKFNEKNKYIIVDSLLIIYGFIVGFPSSIKRCILFFIINSINKYFKLEISSIKILLLVIMILIFNNYKIIYDVGFIYSVVTVSGIILCNDFITNGNKILNGFKLSLVAFIFSLPISLVNFYEINLLSIIYNMFYVPLVSIIVYPLCLISFIIPSVYRIFNFFIIILEGSSNILRSINLFNLYLNFNVIQVLVFYVVTWLVFYKYKYKLIIVLVMIIVLDIISPYFDKNGYVYFFDIGQGDSSLVISPYRKDVILIDTGGVSSYVKEEWMKRESYNVSDNIVSFMKSIGIKNIDLIILSHGDSDHAKDVDNILKDINIKCLNVNQGDLTTLEENAIKSIKTCMYEAKNMDLEYLNYKMYDNENDNSLLTYMKIYNTSILSLGDASRIVEDDLIKRYKINNVDIFKLSHHGSKTSSSEKFIDTINPKYSIISVGRNNKFGHPNKETLDNLGDRLQYRTDKDGSIMFKINNDSLVIKNYEP